jgi:HPt (histidine-containing phosphotransfer) domain-containing protein
MSLHSQLHDLADAAALAGAAELDMTDSAIERATLRTKNLLDNDPRFAELAAAGERLSDPIFYESMGGPVTADPRLARVIAVSTAAESVRAHLMPAVGGRATSTASAQSVAGASEVACQVTPLMLCNPLEPSAFSATRGQLSG